ncbi:MAG: PTS sugar transporter subunit IIA, partial [Gammaproteobacteria bacterium]
AVEFDNIDDLNVDIIVSIIVPSKDFEEHLKLLSCISEKLDNQETRKDLRRARNNRDILTILESNNLEFI